MDMRPPQLAATLTCFPLTARGAFAGVGSNPVNTQGFLYSDYSHTGIARVDGSVVYIPLEQAQLLCMSGVEKRVTAIHIRFVPGVNVNDGTRRVAELWNRFRQTKAESSHIALLDTVKVQDWKQYRRAFIAPMEKEEALLSLMFILVGITTVFIVFVVFYMIITNKRKDIGVIKSVGASNASILALFSGFAFCVGLIGSCVGTLLGLAVPGEDQPDRAVAVRAFQLAVVGPHDLRDRRYPQPGGARRRGGHYRQCDRFLHGRGPGSQLPCGPAAAGGDPPCPADMNYEPTIYHIES
jgi:hypothetical protein